MFSNFSTFSIYTNIQQQKKLRTPWKLYSNMYWKSLSETHFPFLLEFARIKIVKVSSFSFFIKVLECAYFSFSLFSVIFSLLKNNFYIFGVKTKRISLHLQCVHGMPPAHIKFSPSFRNNNGRVYLPCISNHHINCPGKRKTIFEQKYK